MLFSKDLLLSHDVRLAVKCFCRSELRIVSHRPRDVCASKETE